MNDDRSRTVALDYSKAPTGLVPCIAQHHLTGEVLMLGYASREAIDRTLATGLLTFHSRSRDALWTKGETSGNRLRVVSIHADCDGDAVLARVDPEGPACHTGSRSCFGAPPVLAALADRLESRRGARPADSYTARLLADRNQRLKKLGEEAVELAVACSEHDRDGVRREAADLLYHMLVACIGADVDIEDVLGELEARLTAAGPTSSGS